MILFDFQNAFDNFPHFQNSIRHHVGPTAFATLQIQLYHVVDFIYPKKCSNWCTVVINANSITREKGEISAMAEYCDPDLMFNNGNKIRQ